MKQGQLKYRHKLWDSNQTSFIFHPKQQCQYNLTRLQIQYCIIGLYGILNG